MDTGISSTQGAKNAAGALAFHTFGRNPKATGVVMIAMVVLLLLFIILFIVYMGKYKDCENKDKFHGNLSTGGNNPMWHNQMGDAGWGGTMHSTYQPGESRVYSSSAEGGHTAAVTPGKTHSCGGVSSAAAGEAQALHAVQAIGHTDSAKNMSDDALMRVMNGGM
jgi:hypothetical protein